MSSKLFGHFCSLDSFMYSIRRECITKSSVGCRGSGSIVLSVNSWLLEPTFRTFLVWITTFCANTLRQRIVLYRWLKSSLLQTNGSVSILLWLKCHIGCVHWFIYLTWFYLFAIFTRSHCKLAYQRSFEVLTVNNFFQ